MAIPSELQLAMTILLALVLLTIWAAFFGDSSKLAQPTERLSGKRRR
ncbi:hypothetical protein ACFQH3_14730 [Haladaptatus sp. GCM10025707]